MNKGELNLFLVTSKKVSVSQDVCLLYSQRKLQLASSDKRSTAKNQTTNALV